MDRGRRSGRRARRPRVQGSERGLIEPAAALTSELRADDDGAPAARAAGRRQLRPREASVALEVKSTGKSLPGEKPPNSFSSRTQATSPVRPNVAASVSRTTAPAVRSPCHADGMPRTTHAFDVVGPERPEIEPRSAVDEKGGSAPDASFRMVSDVCRLALFERGTPSNTTTVPSAPYRAASRARPPASGSTGSCRSSS